MCTFSCFSRGAVSIAVLGVAAVVAHGAAAKSGKPFVPEFEFPAPLPIVSAAGAKNAVALAGIDPVVESASGLKPGDRVTALVSLLKGKDLTQWVVEVSGVEPDGLEKQELPLQSWTYHTNTGTEVIMSAARAVLAVRVLGPFERTSPERDGGKNAAGRQTRLMVNADFLGLGLDRACEAMMVVDAAKQKDPKLGSWLWGARPRPYSAAETAAGRKMAISLGLTPERERAATRLSGSCRSIDLPRNSLRARRCSQAWAAGATPCRFRSRSTASPRSWVNWR